MLKLWLYGFAVNVRSSRKLEQRVQEDLGFRFLAGGLRPDHKTLSEFLRRHGAAMEELFTQVLGWARQAGMVRWGRVAIDSTRIKANASPDRLRHSDERQLQRWAAGDGAGRSRPGSRVASRGGDRRTLTARDGAGRQ